MQYVHVHVCVYPSTHLQPYSVELTLCVIVPQPQSQQHYPNVCIYTVPILYRGLEQFMREYPEEVNSRKDDDGHTALHLAAANDHLDIVCLLAETVGSYVSCDHIM